MLLSVTKLCLTLCDPMDYSTPGSYVHGISQARVLEWVALECIIKGTGRETPPQPCLGSAPAAPVTHPLPSMKGTKHVDQEQPQPWAEPDAPFGHDVVSVALCREPGKPGHTYQLWASPRPGEQPC